jgi:general secretion pathway protein C
MTEYFSRLRVVQALNVIVAVALAVSGMFLVRNAVTHALKGGADKAGQAIESHSPQVKRKAAERLEHYAPLLRNNPFGFSAAPLVPISPSKTSAAQVPPSDRHSVDLTLMGTIAWTGGFGYAVVSGGSGGQELYRTGQNISGSGQLSYVGSDRILIESGGREIEVRLTEIETSKAVGKGSPGFTGRGRPSSKEFAKRSSENTFIVNQKAVESSLENPKRMLTDARLLPNYVNGKQEGFIIKEIRRNGLYDTLGLRNGDILLRVNELEISDAETGLQAFTALRGMDRINLEVRRNGNNMVLTYLIR